MTIVLTQELCKIIDIGEILENLLLKLLFHSFENSFFNENKIA